MLCIICKGWKDVAFSKSAGYCCTTSAYNLPWYRGGVGCKGKLFYLNR